MSAAAIYLTTRLRGAGRLDRRPCCQLLDADDAGAGAGLWRRAIWMSEGNLAHYVDRMVLGAHNYAGTKTWDPEGIVSTLPAIATALFGIMCGHMLRMRRDLAERTTWLFFAGNLLLARD